MKLSGAKVRASWHGPVLGLGFGTTLLLVAEATLALLGVEPLFDANASFASTEPARPLFVEYRSPTGEVWLETAPAKLRFFNAQRFPADKPPNERRVFCLGGSTTYGRPYDDRTSFCGWLRAYLPRMDPSHEWRVVNAGGVSYASYRVASLMQELTHYEPDVFVVYTGHNEFLERRTYGGWTAGPSALARALRFVMATRSFAAVAGLAHVFRREEELAQLSPLAKLPAEVDAILDHSVGPDAYERDDALRRHVIEHFEDNLERIHDIADQAGARLVTVVPASNLGDCTPFRSQWAPALTASELERARAAFDDGRVARDSGRIERAADLFAEVIRIDPRHADALFEKAALRRAQGRTAEARTLFLAARDEDVCPLRASSEIEQRVREVAKRRGSLLVDFGERLRARAGVDADEFIPGNEEFLDHVHPTIDAHRLLAEDILEILAAAGAVTAGDGWDAAARAEARRQVEAGIDPRRQGLALRNLAKVLSWAGKSHEAARLAERALEKLGADAESSFILGVYALERDDPRRAIGWLREALELEPEFAKAHNGLGVALVRTGELEAALPHYDRAIDLSERAEAPNANAFYNRGNLYVRLGDDLHAIEDYTRALSLDPDHGDARVNLARARERLAAGTAAPSETTPD